MLNNDGFVTIPHADLNRLEAAEKELLALKANGVDNWEGYGLAMAELHGAEDDDLD